MLWYMKQQEVDAHMKAIRKYLNSTRRVHSSGADFIVEGVKRLLETIAKIHHLRTLANYNIPQEKMPRDET